MHAQTTGTVAVTVVDAASGHALEAALIHLPALDLRGSSDEQGRLTLLEVPVGEHEVTVELSRYSPATATVVGEAGSSDAVELRL
ncbi:MAG: hypothetical protein OXH50_18140, partial [Gemmatimonadetes bacterium]|nr:hypothetical protein [Gemmatimonadota bacterium]